MEKTNQKMERQVQELVLEYFKDMDDITVSGVIDAMVYAKPITDNKSNVSEVIDKFLQENGLVDSYLRYMYDYLNPDRYFNRANISDVDMIEKVRQALLNLAFNRYRLLMEKKKERVTNFKFMKRTLLEIFECLNNNKNYIYGKEDDAKIVAKIKSFKS